MGKNNKKKNRNFQSLSAPQSSTQILHKVGNKINGHKAKSRKNKRNKSNRKIQQLFERLRNETTYETDMSLDTISDDTVIELTENDMKMNRMVTPVKSKTQSTPNLIVINDDDDIIINPCREPVTPRSDINSSPLRSSTPKRPLVPNNSVLNNNSSVQKLNSDNHNITREINKDSYLTIDLTSETLNTSNLNKSQMNTVIDLVNNTDNDRDVSQSSSMSGDSQVTVIQNKKRKIGGKQMEKFINGIGKLSSTERQKLLEVIAQKIFKDGDSSSQLSVKAGNESNESSAPKTEEDAFIKEVILGQAPSRNSIGSNIYNPQRVIGNRTGLRMVVIDGSNVAMQHSKGRVFSVKGLKICIEYFVHRGHVVKAFVPQFRCQYGKSTDGKLLDSLERQGLVVYTPSRKVQDKLISSYDDRYIVQCAAEFDGVIVSKDNYRDLLLENPRWRSVIENRLLQFTWVGDLIMFPKDPLGRNGPTLEEFLRHPTIVQYPSIL